MSSAAELRRARRRQKILSSSEDRMKIVMGEKQTVKVDDDEAAQRDDIIDANLDGDGGRWREVEREAEAAEDATEACSSRPEEVVTQEEAFEQRRRRQVPPSSATPAAGAVGDAGSFRSPPPQQDPLERFWATQQPSVSDPLTATLSSTSSSTKRNLEPLAWLLLGLMLRLLHSSFLTFSDAPAYYTCAFAAVWAAVAFWKKSKDGDSGGEGQEETKGGAAFYVGLVLKLCGVRPWLAEGSVRAWRAAADFGSSYCLFVFSFATAHVILSDITMWEVVLAISCVKLLFLHCYRSTDFEVHRNWLAVTHSLPPSEWYVDETSPWTLDYPPAFAWFEWALSQAAVYFDPDMLRVDNLGHASPATVLFQRLTVVFGDLMLAVGVKTCFDGVRRLTPDAPASRRTQLCTLLLANAGLLMVDHVHFQYNGFLSGVALHSAGLMLQDRHLGSAVWFGLLLNLKHIYLYCAPVYFVYLLRHYVVKGELKDLVPAKALGRLVPLGGLVAAVFAASFGPFIYLGQLGQVLKRLFPFKRGLCHAYWAPNFWALYTGADKALAFAGKRLDLVQASSRASMTGGLVQEFDHEVLPSVSPAATFALAAASMAPALWGLWAGRKSPTQFLRALAICSFCSFMFGWHVHEKAILLVVLPLTVMAYLDPSDAALLMPCSLAGHVSLLPLLFRPQEAILRVLLVVFHALCVRKAFPEQAAATPWWQTTYAAGLACVVAFDSAAPLLDATSPYPFLPLMAYSLYCFAGLAWCWIKMYLNFMRSVVTSEKGSSPKMKTS